MALEAEDRLGPYQIVERLGVGGMGEVYRAHDRRLGRDVAIKVLREDVADVQRLRRFEQEARAAGLLNHPNVLAVYDVGTHDGAPYVVSELLEGRTLRAYVALGPLPPSKVLDFALQLAQGLAAAHEKGIVHRDLKPANVFVTWDGRVKILDFGLAKLTSPKPSLDEEGEATVSAVTVSGAVVGTVGYMSPEQVRGERVDVRSDVFSFGAVLYEMLCGRRAFRRENAAETLSAILHDDPPELARGRSGTSAGLARLARRCLEKRPEDRFLSAHDLALAIEAISSGAPEDEAGGELDEPDFEPHPARADVPQRERPSPNAWRSFPSRGRVGWAAAGLLGVAVAVGLVGRTSEQFEHDETRSPSIMPRGSESSRVVERAVTLTRRHLDPQADAPELRALATRVAWVCGGATLKPATGSNDDLLLSAPASCVDEAVVALGLLDALDPDDFAEPNLFTGDTPSSRTVTFRTENADLSRFLLTLGAASGWTVVVERSVGGRFSMELTDVPWDVAANTVMEANGLRAVEYTGGYLWVIATLDRANELEGLEQVLCTSYTPNRISPRRAAELVEGARSERGVVVVNARLKHLAMADRGAALRRYYRILNGVDDPAAPKAHYSGYPISVEFADATLEEVLQFFRDLTSLNFVRAPGTARPPDLSATFRNVPWDAALDGLLVAAGLEYELRSNVVWIHEDTSPEIDVETLRLTHEDPSFFVPFAACLGPEGSVQVDSGSGSLILRGPRARLDSFQRFVSQFDVAAEG